jgi:hypothetical protein
MQSLYTALTFLGFMGCIWSEASVILSLQCLLLQGRAWLKDTRNGWNRKMRMLGGLSYVLGLMPLALCTAKYPSLLPKLVGAEILKASLLLVSTISTNSNIG